MKIEPMEKMYLYEIEDESWGIVIAESKVEAETKVRNAYAKHDSDYNENTPIHIEKATRAENKWFIDSPDVLEVYG